MRGQLFENVSDSSLKNKRQRIILSSLLTHSLVAVLLFAITLATNPSVPINPLRKVERTHLPVFVLSVPPPLLKAKKSSSVKQDKILSIPTEIPLEVKSEQKESVEHIVVSPSSDTARENEQIDQGNVDAGILDGASDGIPGGVVGGSADSPPVLDISDQVTVGELKVLNIQGPRLTKYVEPVYPELARRARIEGTVVIEAIINKDGKIGSVKIIRSYPIFDRVALEAVKKWEYTPTLLRSQPVKVVLTVTINFVITN